MASRPTGPAPTARRARLGAAALALVLAGALVACSSDGSDGGDAKAATTTTTVAADETTTTAADAATSTTAPADGEATTTTAPSSGGGSSSSFSGPLDGQDGAVVRFERGASALTDFTVEGLSLACMPLGDGEESTTATDVVLAEVPVDGNGRVEFTDQDADFHPTVSGEFNAAGEFVGSLSLNGEKGDSACGGEFSFVATAG